MDVFYEGGKNMNLAQILALILFIAMFILIVMDKIERHHVT